MTNNEYWWQNAVVYQVYPRSFADADGDGIGDLAGLRARLDYIARLGVDAIWLNPCYPSPQVDHGYDIADYTGIDPSYGDLGEFDALVKQAQARGLRILMDLVPNHCSAEHPWFKAALAAPTGSPERTRFHFADGRGAGGEEPPNNWRSTFGGPAWSRVTEADGRPGQWYLHLFDAGQPDFNWTNPEVAEFFDQVLRFWFDRGVDGFRIDVAHGMAKRADLADWPDDSYNEHAFNQPEVHTVLRRWRALIDGYLPERELTLVGEIWVPKVTHLAAYLRPGELAQAFYFDLLAQPWECTEIRAAIDAGLTDIASTGATVAWVLSNHDVHRTVTRYGQNHPPRPEGRYLDPIEVARFRGPVNVPLGQVRARAAILLLLALPGSAYLYQGEELGLPEVMEMPDEVRRDPIWRRSEHTKYGRDGSRVPLPWAGEAPNYGFSLDHEGDRPAPPWLPQPDWFAGYAVDRQDGDPGSTLELFRAALSARRELWAGGAQPRWDQIGRRGDVLVLARGDARVVVVFGSDPVALPAGWGDIVLASAPVIGRSLPGNSAAWLRR